MINRDRYPKKQIFPLTYPLVIAFILSLLLLLTQLVKDNILSKRASIMVISPTQTLKTDIIVYGGGTSGVMTAYQAAKLGKRIIIVEPTDWLGGQTSAAGVGCIDTGTNPKELRSGFIPHWLDYVKQTYKELGMPGDQLYAFCHWDWQYSPTHPQICIDPWVAEEAFKKMLNEPDIKKKVQILYQTDIYNQTPFIKEGNKITGLKVRNNKGKLYNIRAKVVVDASEYGDLIPFSGAAFYIGQSGKLTNYQEALQWAKRTTTGVQNITYVAHMRELRKELPSNIKSLYHQKIVQIAPRFYRPNKWSKFFKAGKKKNLCDLFTSGKEKWEFYYHARYRAVGDPYISHNQLGSLNCGWHFVPYVTKFEVNWANDYPPQSSNLSPLFLLDKTYRQQQICKAKERTLQNVAYLEQLRLPWSNNSNNWYLSREDHTCTSNHCYILTQANCPNIPDNLERYMSVIPYVRESIRPNSKFNNSILRYNQVKRNQPSFTDSISITSYPFDVHLNKFPSSKPPTQKGPFQLPLRIFIPTNKNGTPIKGFLVAEKNLGVDQYTQGAIRVQPSVMLIGQATGVLASLAVNYNGDTSRIKAVQVQNLLTSPQAMSKISTYYYTDIKYGQYSKEYKYSELTSALGLLGGYNKKWSPHSQTNRAQVAVILDRLGTLIGIPLKQYHGRSYNDRFKDVDGCWCKPYVKKLYEAGITNGCAEKAFCPNRKINLNELVTLLGHMVSISKNRKVLRVNSSCRNVLLPSTIPSWAKPWYIRLVQTNLLPTVKTNRVCKIKFLTDRCSNYRSCTIPAKPLTRLDIAELVWDIYFNYTMSNISSHFLSPTPTPTLSPTPIPQPELRWVFVWGQNLVLKGYHFGSQVQVQISHQNKIWVNTRKVVKEGKEDVVYINLSTLKNFKIDGNQVKLQEVTLTRLK